MRIGSARFYTAGVKAEERLPVVFATIVIAEIVSIAALFWFGAHFA